MFRCFFGDDTFIDDFFEMIEDFVNDLNKERKQIQEKCGDDKKDCTKSNQHEHSHSYKKESTYVDGELVDYREEEWKDGKRIKQEHRTNCLNDNDNSKRICGCDSKKCKKDDDVEYAIELNDDDNVETLKKCINQLCNDAEKDHKTIAELRSQIFDLKLENGVLRADLDDANKDFNKRESELLECIDNLKKDNDVKDSIIESFNSVMEEVRRYDNSKKLNQ